MDRKEIKAEMKSVMKEAKSKIKDMKAACKPIKKKNRGTEEYEQANENASNLAKEILDLFDRYKQLSNELYKI